MLPQLVDNIDGARLPEDEARGAAAAARRTTTRRSRRSARWTCSPHFKPIIVPDSPAEDEAEGLQLRPRPGDRQVRRHLRRRGPARPRPAEEGRRSPSSRVRGATSSASSASSTTSTRARTCSPASSPTEYALWFDLLLPGPRRLRRADPARRHLEPLRRARSLVELGAWDPFNVTEDADLGLRLHKAGYKTAMLDSTTLEEANSELRNWIRQRSRWVKGYLQTYLVHMRHPFRLAARDRLQQLPLLPVHHRRHVIFLLNPIFWALTTLWLFTEAGVIEELFPGFVFYAASFQLFIGNFIFIYLTVAGALQRGLFDLPSTRCSRPLYWGLMSIGAWTRLHPALHEALLLGEDGARPRRRRAHWTGGSRRPAGSRWRPPPAPCAAADRRRRSARAADRGLRRGADAAPVARSRRSLIFLVFAVGFALLGYKVVVDQHVVVFDALDRLTRAFMVWHNDPPKLAAIGFALPPIDDAGADLRSRRSSRPRHLRPRPAALPRPSSLPGRSPSSTACSPSAEMPRPVRLVLLVLVARQPDVRVLRDERRRRTLSTSVFAAFALFCIRRLGSRTALPRYLIGAGLAFALAVLTRYEYIIWAFFLGLRHRRRADAARRAAATRSRAR